MSERQDVDFVPCQESLRFFSVKKSVAEVTQKLNSLHNEQKKVEEELRKEVRKHYRTFLYTNKEIEKIGNHVSELKLLVDDTIDLVKTLKTIEIKQEYGNRYNGSTKSSTLKRNDRNLNETADPKQVISVANSFPSWIQTAPETIDKLIVQQQFHTATELILNVRKYRKGVDDNFQKLQSSMSSSTSSSQSTFGKYKEQYETLAIFCNKVELMVQKLVEHVSFSLNNLAHSKLWGIEEHARRLRLLVTLGASEEAAHAFCESRKDLVSRALNAYQPTGDSFEYVSIMSNVFFGLLVDASESFLQLFLSDAGAVGDSLTTTGRNRLPVLSYDISALARLDPLVLTHLQDWSQDQIISFLKVVMTQIRVGVNEKMSNVFMRLRSLYAVLTNSKFGNDGNDDDHDDEDDDDDDDNDNDNEMDNALLQFTMKKNTVIEESVTGTIVDTAEVILTEEGPLQFLSKCLSVLCVQASKLDVLTSCHVKGKACVCLHIMPDIQRIVNSLGDAVIKELGHWMDIQQQEQWQEHDNLCLTIIPPDVSFTEHLSSKKASSSTQLSSKPAVVFDWITLMLSQYIHDAWILFSESQPGNDHVKYYSRADVCEAESSAVSSILRVLIRFCLQLENSGSILSATAQKAQTSVQMKRVEVQIHCFVTTLKMIVVHLMPSVNSCLMSFFSNSSVNTPLFEEHPPQVILQLLCQRLEDKGKMLAKLNTTRPK